MNKQIRHPFPESEAQAQEEAAFFRFAAQHITKKFRGHILPRLSNKMYLYSPLCNNGRPSTTS